MAHHPEGTGPQWSDLNNFGGITNAGSANDRVEFDELFQSVCNWGKWGKDDEKGTLNYLTPRHTADAARLVRSGRTVSLAIPLNTKAGPDNPHPAAHHMIQIHDVATPEGEPRFALDYLATEFHGDCFTHIDALCHISYKGLLYNGKPASLVTSKGSLVQDIATYAHGIVGALCCWTYPGFTG